MERKVAMARLKSLELELRSQGLSALYLFGSTAREEASPGSDLDLLFEVAPGARFSLFDQARISRQLSERLQASVDLVSRRSLHPLLRTAVEAEQVRVFG